MNGKIKCKVSVLTIMLILFTGLSFSSELDLIVKVKAGLLEGGQDISAVATGNAAWNALNKVFCGSELKRLSFSLKDDKNAEELGLSRIYTFRLACVNEDTASVIHSYMETGCFEFVEVNEILKSVSAMSNEPFFPNDPYWLFQWPLHNTGIDLVDTVKSDADIDMPQAWGIEQGDTSVIIAILDGGITNFHNEFDGRLWINKNEIPDNGVDDDNNGYIDDVNGWNFVANNNYLKEDTVGHGTAIASIIGSNVNNGQGLAGVNGKSKLMVLKITDSVGNAYTDKMTNAIQYAVNNNAKVINLSLAGQKYSQVTEVYTNLAYGHNVTICAGSGNKNVDTVYYPAKLAHVIAVGATTRNDKRCTSLMGKTINSGSNYGDSLDVVAPGDSITIIYYKNGAYIRNGGTSFSTAYVSGLASLLISQDTSRTPDDIYRLITSTAEDQVGDPLEDTPGYDKCYGYGRINAYKALLAGQATSLRKKSKQAQRSMQFINVYFVKSRNQLLITIIDNKNQSSAAEFTLLTPSGRLVYSVNKIIASNEFSINLPHLSGGIYCYSINLNGNSHCGKFVF